MCVRQVVDRGLLEAVRSPAPYSHGSPPSSAPLPYPLPTAVTNPYLCMRAGLGLSLLSISWLALCHDSAARLALFRRCAGSTAPLL